MCNADGIESNSKFILKITIQVLEIQKNNIKTCSIKKQNLRLEVHLKIKNQGKNNHETCLQELVGMPYYLLIIKILKKYLKSYLLKSFKFMFGGL